MGIHIIKKLIRKGEKTDEVGGISEGAGKRKVRTKNTARDGS